jgi:hypothetical protein
VVVSIDGVVHRVRSLLRHVPGGVMVRCCDPPDICVNHRYWVIVDFKTNCGLEEWSMRLPGEGEVTCLSCLSCT